MRKPNILAVVGTDTGIGKTTVAAALAAHLARGHRVAVLKPAETGTPAPPDPPEDADLLAKAARTGQSLDSVVPYTYPLPASPLTAALSNPPIPHLPTLLQHARHLSQTHDTLLLEGAGGLLVPYAPDWTYADLLTLLRPRILLVARSGLGTINHTLLTVEALLAREIPPAAILLNQLAPNPGPEEPQTPAIIARHTHLPVLGPLPHIPLPKRRSPQALRLWLEPYLPRLLPLLFGN